MQDSPATSRSITRCRPCLSLTYLSHSRRTPKRSVPHHGSCLPVPVAVFDECPLRPRFPASWSSWACCFTVPAQLITHPSSPWRHLPPLPCRYRCPHKRLHVYVSSPQPHLSVPRSNVTCFRCTPVPPTFGLSLQLLFHATLCFARTFMKCHYQTSMFFRNWEQIEMLYWSRKYEGWLSLIH